MCGVKKVRRDCLWSIPDFLYYISRKWEIIESKVDDNYIVLLVVGKRGSVKGKTATAIAERRYKNIVKFCPDDTSYFSDNELFLPVE